MRVQNQLSFADWQNFILITKKIRWKFFPAAVSGDRRSVVAVGIGGRRSVVAVGVGGRRLVVAVGVGARRRSMAVAVTINGARWWSMEKR